jgi:uncharacterized protein involved in outer membrane biogenesis
MARTAGSTGAILLALVLVPVLTLALIPLNWLKGPIVERVEAATGRTLRIEGDLDIDWGLRPTLRVGRLQFENADWSDVPIMVEAGSLTISIDLPKLFAGHVVIPEISVREPQLLLERGPDRRPNWKLREEKPEEPPSLPDIRRLHIEDARVRYREQATETDVQVQLQSGADTGGGSLRVEGEGTLHGETFVLNARGDSLLALYDAKRPYRLRVDLQARENKFRAEGTLDDPLQLGALDLRLAASGPDPARLNDLLQISLPSLPPYDVQGRLQLQGETWLFTDLIGTVGDSDLQGRFSVRLDGKLPRVSADLQSKRLDLDDLGGLVGAEPAAGPGETVSPEQRQAKGERKAGSRILPDDPIDAQKLQSFNADVRYRAARVDAGKLPIDGLEIDARIQNGELRLTPLRFQIGKGSVDAQTMLNTRKKPLSAEVLFEVRNVDLRRVLAAFEISDESAGTVAGRAKLWMEGDSVGALLASTDGGLYLLMTGGYLDQLLVELAGLDAAESVAAFLGKDKNVPIECGYADLQSKDGVVRIPTLVIDSTDTLFLADGSIDFNDESLNVELRPEPKDWSPVALRGPLHIEGTFKDVELRPGASVLARGAAAVLTAAAAPVAALLPLIETGPAKGESSPLCGTLMQTMRKDTEKEQRQE